MSDGHAVVVDDPSIRLGDQPLTAVASVPATIHYNIHQPPSTATIHYNTHEPPLTATIHYNARSESGGLTKHSGMLCVLEVDLLAPLS